MTIAKVGSGYTDTELFSLNVFFARHKDECIPAGKSVNVSDWLDCGPEKPDVYIRPEHSKIVQVLNLNA